MADTYNDPVNYELTETDLDRADFNKFLEELTDVPASNALKPFSVNKAGIIEQQAYVKLRSLSRTDEPVVVLANIKMQASITNQRGIHMSRCEEALFSLLEDTHKSLDSFATELANTLLNAQHADDAYVGISGTYMHKRQTTKSRKDSYDRMTMLADVSVHKSGRPTVNIGLSVYNMTGCPCTETFTKFSVVPQLKTAGYSLAQIKTILNITKSGTHTQRGLATLKVDNIDQNVSYTDLYKVLDKSCHLAYELLKRPDEHELVMRVLSNPQFTEDVVRDIAHYAVETIGRKLSSDSRIFASSQLYDSIHIHDVYAEIDKTLDELENERIAKASS